MIFLRNLTKPSACRRRVPVALALAMLFALKPPAFGQAAKPAPSPLQTPGQTPAPSPLQTPAQAQTGPKILDIIVLGNKIINRESIIAASGLKIGQQATPAALDTAKRNLVQQGNFGMHKERPEDGVNIRLDNTPEGARVVIDVDENDVVKGINITGTGPIKAADVQNVLQTKQGQVFNMNTLFNDVLRIRQLYEAKGYQAYILDTVGMTDGILNIPIKVGTINRVKVNGLKKTKAYVVTREMKQKPGSYFNINELRNDLRRIFDTQLFENVDPAFTYPELGKVDVTLNMTERRTGTVSVGVGYSSRQKLVGHAELGETNFLGRGQQVNLVAETGGPANRSSLELGFTEPWLDARHTSLSVSVFDKTVYRFGQSISSTIGSEQGVSSDYYEVHTGAQVTVGRPFSEAYQGFVGFRFDNVRVPTLRLNPQDISILQNGPLATINLRLTHNTRDFIQDPATGGYEILTTDIGHADLRPIHFVLDPGSPDLSPVAPSGGVQGNVNWTKYGIDARRYFSPQGRRINPKDRRHVFALRLMVGSSTGTLPYSEQYFIGGAETLRGYNEDRFWGKNMLLGSFEYRLPLAESLIGVLFTDVGDAWGGPYENVRFSGFTQHSGLSPSVGFGFGLRVRTPIGPIRIDEGFGREGAHTHFSIGQVF